MQLMLLSLLLSRSRSRDVQEIDPMEMIHRSENSDQSEDRIRYFGFRIGNRFITKGEWSTGNFQFYSIQSACSGYRRKVTQEAHPNYSGFEPGKRFFVRTNIKPLMDCSKHNPPILPSPRVVCHDTTRNTPSLVLIKRDLEQPSTLCRYAPAVHNSDGVWTSCEFQRKFVLESQR
jgi:hypothetical protein